MLSPKPGDTNVKGKVLTSIQNVKKEQKYDIINYALYKKFTWY